MRLTQRERERRTRREYEQRHIQLVREWLGPWRKGLGEIHVWNVNGDIRHIIVWQHMKLYHFRLPIEGRRPNEAH